jgi:hypothetical protein
MSFDVRKMRSIKNLMIKLLWILCAFFHQVTKKHIFLFPCSAFWKTRWKIKLLVIVDSKTVKEDGNNFRFQKFMIRLQVTCCFFFFAFCYFWGLIKGSNEYQGKFIANVNFKMRKEFEWTYILVKVFLEFNFFTGHERIPDIIISFCLTE